MRGRRSKRRLLLMGGLPLVIAASVVAAMVGTAAPAKASGPEITSACPSAPAGFARCFALQVGSAQTGPQVSGYGPADLQTAYKLPSSTHGSGQTIAIVDAYDHPTIADDVNKFSTTFGLPLICGTAGASPRSRARSNAANHG